MPLFALRSQGLISVAQRQHLDALPAERRCDTLNEWAFNAYGNNSKPYAWEALKLAKTIFYPRGIADASMRLAQECMYLGELDSAAYYFQNALDIRMSRSDSAGAAGCYHELAQLEKARGNDQRAVDYYQQGLAIFDHIPSHINEAYMHNGLAMSYRALGMYNRAMEECEKSMQVYHELKKRPDANLRDIGIGIAQSRMHIAILLQENLEQFQAARDSLQKCVADFSLYQDLRHGAKCLQLLGNNAYYKGQSAVAILFYDQALAGDHLSVADRASIQRSRGRVYLHQRAFPKAMEDFQTALGTFSELKNNGEIAATYNEIGNLHYEQKEFVQAVDAYRKALEKEPGNPAIRGNLLYYLPNALNELGKSEEAAKYSRDYLEFLKKLTPDQALMALNQTRQLYVEKNRVEKDAFFQEQQTQRLYMWLTGIGLLLVIVLLMWFNNAHGQKRLLAEKTAQLANQEKLEVLRTLEMEKYIGWLKGQEETQQKIGRELHDNLGSVLTAVKMHFADVNQRIGKLETEHRQQYDKANLLLDHACVEVRRISHELSNALLTNFGLKAQLESMADTLRSTGEFEVELEMYGLEERLSNSLEINAYRMTQILTHNVVAHAEASKIIINVNRFNNLLNIMVEDNGKGFVLNEARKKGGIGIRNLQARVHEFDGTLLIDSTPNQGTRISIDLPIPAHDPSYLATNN